jgi:hypothetical protein
MPQEKVDLTRLFQAVAQTLEQNQQALNQSDTLNHDHGTNMVQTFHTISRSLEVKKGKTDSTALAHAAKQLAKKSSSGSGQLYAKGLAQAATQFKGKQVDEKGAMQLLQTLIGGGQAAQPASGDLLGTLLGGMAGSQVQQAPQAGGDLLGSLLGGLAGGAQNQEQPAPQPGGDLLGSLLGGLAGGGNAPSGSQAQGGLDLGDLLNAGMAFMQAKQSGGNTMQALVQAFMAANGMGGAAHRTQSTEIVVNSFLQALAANKQSQ